MQEVTQAQPPGAPAAVAGHVGLLAGLGLLVDGMGGDHHHRAEGAGVGVIQALPPVGDAEVGRGAQGFDFRVHLLQVAAQPFLAVVHAADQLGARAAGTSGPATPALVGQQGGEDPIPVMVFVGA